MLSCTALSTASRAVSMEECLHHSTMLNKTWQLATAILFLIPFSCCESVCIYVYECVSISVVCMCVGTHVYSYT